jgi:hypothetical protein
MPRLEIAAAVCWLLAFAAYWLLPWPSAAWVMLAAAAAGLVSAAGRLPLRRLTRRAVGSWLTGAAAAMAAVRRLRSRP